VSDDTTEDWFEDMPDGLYSDIESAIHIHMNHDGQSDEANDWVTDLMSAISPFVVRELRGLESRLTAAEAALAEIGRLDGMYCRSGEGSGEFRRRVHWQLRRLASVSAPEETT
jgi:hypothetical protein